MSRSHYVQLNLTTEEIVSLKLAIQRALATYGDLSEAQSGSHLDTLCRTLQLLEFATLGVHHVRYSFQYSEPLHAMRPLEADRREFLLPEQCGGRVYIPGVRS